MIKLLFSVFRWLIGEERLITRTATGVNKGLLSLKHFGYLYESGWVLSYEERNKVSIDKNGQPIPWFSFPILDLLENRLRKEMIVFEYGAGNSTLYFGKKVKDIHAVESDQDWFNRISKNKSTNVHLYLEEVSKSSEGYIQSVSSVGVKFHVIIVDGLYRDLCLNYCVNFLTDDGIIIVDDTREYDYKNSINELLSKGFKKMDFVGMSSFVITSKTTSILYRPNNCFDI